MLSRHAHRASIPASLYDVEALRALIPPGPQDVVALIPFAYDSSSPMTLVPLLAGASVIRCAIVLATALDGIGATLQVGTAGSPGLVIGVDDVDAGMAGQYETDLVTRVALAAPLILTITPAGSTMGAGVVLVEVKE